MASEAAPVVHVADGATDASGMVRGSDEFVEAFARGLAVIRAFGRGGGALTITEVAQRAGLTRAGARRLLHTLAALGYAQIDGNRFALTPLVLELGFAYLSSLPLRDLARPVIDEFARRYGEQCSLAVLDGLDVVYVVRAELRSPLRRSVGIGERLPVHATSTGQVLLAGLDAAALDGVLARAPFPRFTPHTICEADALRRAVEQARAQGWALANETLELGVCGLAVPVVDGYGRTVGAVTLSANLARHEPLALRDRFLPGLTEVARRIGAGLGAH